MHAVAAIPAVGLLAGSAFGFLVPEVPDLVGHAALAACASVAVCAWCTSRALVPALAAGTVFSTGGARYFRPARGGLPYASPSRRWRELSARMLRSAGARFL